MSSGILLESEGPGDLLQWIALHDPGEQEKGRLT